MAMGGTVLVVGNAFGWLTSIVALLLRIPGYVLYSAVASSPPMDPNSLKAAIHNVTTDFNQLVYLLENFMESGHAEPGVEMAFRRFLAQQASKSLPSLERTLDWVLALYKFMFPFAILSLLARASSSSKAAKSPSSGVGDDKRNAESITYLVTGPSSAQNISTDLIITRKSIGRNSSMGSHGSARGKAGIHVDGCDILGPDTPCQHYD